MVGLRGLELRAKHAVAIEPVSREWFVNFGRQGRREILRPAPSPRWGFVRRDAEPTPQQPMRVWPIREQPGNDNPHRLLRRKAEDVILPGPFGRQIGEAGYPHAVRKPPLYSGSDQIRREERKRDRHIDLADAAALPFCDAFRACR